MSGRVFWSQINRAFNVAGVPLPGAKVYFYDNGTTTQKTVYASLNPDVAHPQPVEADGNGIFDTVFSLDASPVRVLMTDQNDVPLTGYPMDDIVPLAVETTGASSVAFTPTESIPATDVQAAIEAAAGLVTDQSNRRSLTPWVTGGTANAFTIAPDPALTALGTQQTFIVRPNRSNTGAVTLNVNGLGARPWENTSRTGTPVAMAAGDLQPYRDVIVTYDGVRFLSSVGVGPATGFNANGQFERLPGGTLLCWRTSLTLVYASSSLLNVNWVFPAPFVNGTVVATGIIPTGVGNYINIPGNMFNVLDLRVTPGSNINTSVTFSAIQTSGMPTFSTNAQLTNVRAFAIGRWF